MSGDSLGDRMKGYEAAETGRVFMPLLPVIARIDGRCFSAFTRGMNRPWDLRLAKAMDATTADLVEETSAIAGYTQSDEISLLWFTDDPKSEMLFGGKVFKLTSVLASMTTSFFIRQASKYLPDEFMRRPISFDARVFQVPNKTEAANCFLWREQDATKNAVSMAARAVCSHRSLQGLNGPQMQELMFQTAGVNFNDYPARFKRGAFVLRRSRLKELDAETVARIPEQHRPTGPILRHVTECVDMPRFGSVTNRVAVLFDGAEPLSSAEPTATHPAYTDGLSAQVPEGKGA